MIQPPTKEDVELSNGQKQQVWAPLWFTTPNAVLATGSFSGLLYLGLVAVGAFPTSVVVSPPGEQMWLSTVLGTSIVAAVGGSLLYWILTRCSESPVVMFRRIAAGVLVFSFVTPFTIPEAPFAMIGGLLLLHITVAVVVTTVLTYPG